MRVTFRAIWRGIFSCKWRSPAVVPSRLGIPNRTPGRVVGRLLPRWRRLGSEAFAGSGDPPGKVSPAPTTEPAGLVCLRMQRSEAYR